MRHKKYHKGGDEGVDNKLTYATCLRLVVMLKWNASNYSFCKKRLELLYDRRIQCLKARRQLSTLELG